MQLDNPLQVSIPSLSELTYEELAQIPRERLVAILPVGATEAHGPHLPLGTDVIIAEAMARAGAERLAAAGFEVLILPSVAFSVADFAAGFAGTISLRPETATALMSDVMRSLARHGVSRQVIANAHLDPTHIGSIRAAVEETAAVDGLEVLFPDVTRKPWAKRLTDEFKSGACHAGCYEGSVVLAERPELVREAIRATLPENPASLSQAIRAGLSSFEQANGPRAYFGAPAAATAAEGRTTIATLGQILFDAVEQAGWSAS